MDIINKRTQQEKLKLVFGDVTLGVRGSNFEYLFSYACGGLESLVIDGKEWLYRAPKPTFWRATTDNDRGNHFAYTSAMWLGADQFIKCTGADLKVDGEERRLPTAPHNNMFDGVQRADRTEITFHYQTATMPSASVDVSYEVTAGGRIRVDVRYHGNKHLPELPVFGMRFLMPTKAVGYQYKGLSGETYPDRMAGGVPGIYRICGLPMTPYLVPQDCQVHMDTKWLEIYRNSTLNPADKKHGTELPAFGIRFSAVDETFAFSCLPYTAEELENATHKEELPLARRTVVCILGAVRGVGGINSWGEDVEKPYHIDAGKDIYYSFYIEKAVNM